MNASLTTVLSSSQALLVERAKTYHSGIGVHLRSAAGYTLLFGQTLLMLKASVPAGQFTALRKAELPEIPERTCQYYMALTRTLKTRSATVADLLDQPELVTTPQLSQAAEAKLNKVVHDEFDGKTITAVCREEKVIRDAKHQKDVPQVKPKKLSLAEAHAEAVALAEKDAASLRIQRMGFGARFTFLDDLAIQALIVQNEEENRAMHLWLKTPRQDRKMEVIEKMLKPATTPHKKKK